MRYLMTRRAKVIHQVDDEGRSHESCNLDAARKTLVELADLDEVRLMESERGARVCRRCFPSGEPPSAVMIPGNFSPAD